MRIKSSFVRMRLLGAFTRRCGSEILARAATSCDATASLRCVSAARTARSSAVWSAGGGDCCERCLWEQCKSGPPSPRMSKVHDLTPTAKAAALVGPIRWQRLVAAFDPKLAVGVVNYKRLVPRISKLAVIQRAWTAVKAGRCGLAFSCHSPLLGRGR